MKTFWTRASVLLLVALAAVGLTSCNKYGLTGHVDPAGEDAHGVVLRGWVNAADPAFSNSGWTMVAFRDGVQVPIRTQRWVPRPDVVTAIGPNSWGYEVSPIGLPFGDHEICLDAVPVADAATATAASSIGCATVVVPEVESRAYVDRVSMIDDDVRIEGWVYTSPFAATPVEPALLLDGVEVEADFVAGSRPDAAAGLRTADANVWGLDQADALDPGAHRVCLGTAGSATTDPVALSCVDVDVPA